MCPFYRIHHLLSLLFFRDLKIENLLLDENKDIKIIGRPLENFLLHSRFACLKSILFSDPLVCLLLLFVVVCLFVIFIE